MVTKANKTDKSVKADKPVKTDQPVPVAKTAKVAKPELKIKPAKAGKKVRTEPVTKEPIKTATVSKTVKQDKMDLTNLKRLPKSLRTYQRRMKQIAHQEGTTYRSLIARHPFTAKAGEALPVPVDD